MRLKSKLCDKNKKLNIHNRLFILLVSIVVVLAIGCIGIDSKSDTLSGFEYSYRPVASDSKLIGSGSLGTVSDWVYGSSPILPIATSATHANYYLVWAEAETEFWSKNVPTYAGMYKVKAIFEENAIYERLETPHKVFEIKRKPIKKPDSISGLEYNGQLLFGVMPGEGYELTNHTAIGAGSYNASVYLNFNYIWDDGSTNNFTVPYTIAKFALPAWSEVGHPVTINITPDWTYLSGGDAIVVSSKLLPKPHVLYKKLDTGAAKEWIEATPLEPGKYAAKALFDETNDTLAFETGEKVFTIRGSILSGLSVVPHDIFNNYVLGNKLPQPQKMDGYEFGGWYKDASFTGEKINVVNDLTDNVVLYAKYNKIGGSDNNSRAWAIFLGILSAMLLILCIMLLIMLILRGKDKNTEEITAFDNKAALASTYNLSNYTVPLATNYAVPAATGYTPPTAASYTTPAAINNSASPAAGYTVPTTTNYGNMQISKNIPIGSNTTSAVNDTVVLPAITKTPSSIGVKKWSHLLTLHDNGREIARVYEKDEQQVLLVYISDNFAEKIRPNYPQMSKIPAGEYSGAYRIPIENINANTADLQIIFNEAKRYRLINPTNG